MSMDAVTAFLQTLAGDAALREQLSPSGKTEDEQLAALVAAGNAKGHEFTVDELKSVLDAIPSAAEGELGEEELSQAAGGATRKYPVSYQLQDYLSGFDYVLRKK